jgi:hypothetical protein
MRPCGRELHPCKRIFTNADGKIRPRVKSCSQDKRGHARTSGRKERADGKFYRRTSV